MWAAFPPSDYYADSATPPARQPASGLAGPPPAARRARGASHVHHDPFDRVGSRLYPYSTSGESSQSLAGHHAQVDEPDVERAAVNQGGIVAVDDPYPPGFGSFLKSRGFYHQFALALPFGLASTHAGVWQCRPAVTSSGPLHPNGARSRARGGPPASPSRCISPGPAFQPTRKRCCRPSSPFAWRLVAQDLPTGHRQRRDHRHGARPSRSDDPREHIAPALIDSRAAMPLVALSTSADVRPRHRRPAGACLRSAGRPASGAGLLRFAPAGVSPTPVRTLGVRGDAAV
jgi:hypothetical protein